MLTNTRTSMAKNKEAVKLAKQILAVHAFKPTADPECRFCKGSGEVEEQSHHNGDYYMTGCDCLQRNRPPDPYLSVYSKELVLMAKHYLKGL